jgi:hypothetical protein
MSTVESKKSRIRKGNNLRTRSPASQSPVTKARKATIGECIGHLPDFIAPTSPSVLLNCLSLSEQIPEEMSDRDGSKKTWKGKVAKQWKKMQQGPTQAMPMAPYPEGGSIGESTFRRFLFCKVIVVFPELRRLAD